MSSHRYHATTPTNPRGDRLSRIIRSTRHNHSSSQKRYNHNHNHSHKEHSLFDGPSDPDSPNHIRSKYKSRSKGKLHTQKSRTSKPKHKRSRYHGKSAATRRKQRDLNFQYKHYSLKEIIDKITTKSSIISTNTAKETLITYYQTFTTSHELIEQLEHRFFGVLPTEEEDKSAHPYISDTDSVSERHFFKSKHDASAYDESKAYCIQVRVINLLTFWMKEYFMEDFNETEMLRQLKSFVERIKGLKTKQKLPSIPYDDETMMAPVIDTGPTPISDVPPIPDLNSEDNNIYSKLVHDNKERDIVIHINKSHPKRINGGFTVHSNPLHPANTTSNSHINIDAGDAATGTASHSQSMKTEQMERIATIISPIHPAAVDAGHSPLFVTNPMDNTVYIPSEQLCAYHSDTNATPPSDTVHSCVMIQGVGNTKVMIRNICDYTANNGYKPKALHVQMEEEQEQKHETEEEEPLQLQFKRHRNIFSKHSEESMNHNHTPNHKELTENLVSTPLASSQDLREPSMTTPSFRMEEPLAQMEDNIVRRYYVKDPSKYKSLADKIEKVLFKQKKEAPVSTHFIQNRRSMRKRDKSYSTSSICSMAQLGSSLSGSKLINERFLEKILPLKEDFQNKVKNREIAEQITLMTFKAFKRVRKREFIDQAWKCKDRLELAGNLCQLIDHFNCISRWVQLTILHCKDVKKRGRMIKKFIKIMDILLELNNFQSLCAVYGAVTSSSIYALESAWQKVPEKHKNQFEEIKKYFITANNMANLRALHKERNPPMIPYTGIYLQDLIQTEERFKERMAREQKKSDYDFTGSGGVVFDHLSKMSKQIDNILIYAKTPYQNIEEDHVIQKYILSEFADQANLNEEDIYKMSENVAKSDS